MQSDVKNQIIKFIVGIELLMISITPVLGEHQLSRHLVILNAAEKWIFRPAFCFDSYMKLWQFFKIGQKSWTGLSKITVEGMENGDEEFRSN